MALSVALSSLLVVFTSILFYFFREHMSYWKKRGIPHFKPSLFVGNMQGVASSRHLIDPFRDLYKKFKGTAPFCGIYFFHNPAAMLMDLDLIKKVLVKDFNNFVDRGMFFNAKDDPISAHIFSIEGAKWRSLRSKLSAAFSSSRMKFMFPTVVAVAETFTKVLDEFVGEDGAVVELKELNARFTTDVVGTCVFGLDVNSLRDPKAQMYESGQMVFRGRRNELIMMFLQGFPRLASKFRMRMFPYEVAKFFMGMVRNNEEYREKNNIKRNDFMDILIELKNEKKDGRNGFTLEEIAAHAFAFYMGGFETSSSTMAHALLELARNIEIQERLRTEVNEALTKHKGELTSESLEEMPYLLQVFNESLRRYAAMPLLQRIAIDDYPTGDPKYTIEKGTTVFIPVESIQMDPEYYPDPEKFDPDRFRPEEIAKRDTAMYLPFGDGPRKCIAPHFGKMQARIGLALLIKNFKFSFCKKTQYPLKFDNKQVVLQAADGIYLKVERV